MKQKKFFLILVQFLAGSVLANPDKDSNNVQSQKKENSQDNSQLSREDQARIAEIRALGSLLKMSPEEIEHKIEEALAKMKPPSEKQPIDLKSQAQQQETDRNFAAQVVQQEFIEPLPKNKGGGNQRQDTSRTYTQSPFDSLEKEMSFLVEKSETYDYLFQHYFSIHVTIESLKQMWATQKRGYENLQKRSLKLKEFLEKQETMKHIGSKISQAANVRNLQICQMSSDIMKLHKIEQNLYCTPEIQIDLPSLRNISEEIFLKYQFLQKQRDEEIGKLASNLQSSLDHALQSCVKEREKWRKEEEEEERLRLKAKLENSLEKRVFKSAAEKKEEEERYNLYMKQEEERHSRLAELDREEEERTRPEKEKARAAERARREQEQKDREEFYKQLVPDPALREAIDFCREFESDHLYSSLNQLRESVDFTLLRNLYESKVPFGRYFSPRIEDWEIYDVQVIYQGFVQKAQLTEKSVFDSVSKDLTELNKFFKNIMSLFFKSKKGKEEEERRKREAEQKAEAEAERLKRFQEEQKAEAELLKCFHEERKAEEERRKRAAEQRAEAERRKREAERRKREAEQKADAERLKRFKEEKKAEEERRKLAAEQKKLMEEEVKRLLKEALAEEEQKAERRKREEEQKAARLEADRKAQEERALQEIYWQLAPDPKLNDAIDFYLKPENTDQLTGLFEKLKQEVDLYNLRWTLAKYDHPGSELVKSYVKDWTISDIQVVYQKFVQDNKELMVKPVFDAVSKDLTEINQFFKDLVSSFLNKTKSQVDPQILEEVQDPVIEEPKVAMIPIFSGVKIGVESIDHEALIGAHGDDAVLSHSYFQSVERCRENVSMQSLQRKVIEIFCARHNQDFQDLAESIGMVWICDQTLTEAEILKVLVDIRSSFESQFQFEGLLNNSRNFLNRSLNDGNSLNEQIRKLENLTRLIWALEGISEKFRWNALEMQRLYLGLIIGPRTMPYAKELYDSIAQNKQDARVVPLLSFLVNYLNVGDQGKSAGDDLKTKITAFYAKVMPKTEKDLATVIQNAASAKKSKNGSRPGYDALNQFFDRLLTHKYFSKIFNEYQDKYWAISFWKTLPENKVKILLKACPEYEKTEDLSRLVRNIQNFFSSKCEPETKVLAFDLAEKFLGACTEHEQALALQKEGMKQQSEGNRIEHAQTRASQKEEKQSEGRKVFYKNLKDLFDEVKVLAQDPCGSLFEDFYAFTNLQKELQKNDNFFSKEQIIEFGESQFIETLVQLATGNNRIDEKTRLEKIFLGRMSSCRPERHLKIGRVLFASMIGLSNQGTFREAYQDNALCIASSK